VSGWNRVPSKATLYHHGVSGTPDRLRTRGGRVFLDELDVPGDARERIEVARDLLVACRRG
jgi:hypothetical protein